MSDEKPKVQESYENESYEYESSPVKKDLIVEETPFQVFA